VRHRVRPSKTQARTPTLPVLSYPRIDYGYLQIRKMPSVSGGKRGAPRERYACDLCVAHVNWTPGFLPLGSY
jgi:hypothetical protein